MSSKSGSGKSAGRSKGTFAIGIVAVALIAGVIGVGIGTAQKPVSQSVAGLSASTNYTYVYGTAKTGPQTGGYPVAVYFLTDFGTLTSAIGPNGLYGLFLPSHFSYTARIEWQNTTATSYYSTGLSFCNAQPYTITPSGAYVLQNLSCY